MTAGAGARPVDELLETYPKLRQDPARHEGKAPKDSSPSGWDYYLACEGVRNGLSDTELTAIIRHARRDSKGRSAATTSRARSRTRERRRSTSPAARPDDPAAQISQRWGLTSDPIVSGQTIGDIASGGAVAVILERESGARLRLPCLADLFDPRAHTRIVSQVTRAEFPPLNNAEAVRIAQLMIRLCGGQDDDPLAEARQWISATSSPGWARSSTRTRTAAPPNVGPASPKRADEQAAFSASRDAAARTVAMRDEKGELWLPAGR